MPNEGILEQKIPLINWNTYLLEKVDLITPEQIENLKTKILPKYKKIFEELPEDKILIYVTLYNLNQKELIDLKEYCAKITNKEPYYVGLHYIKNWIALLSTYTGEEI